MLKDSEADAAARERLSALADGELEGGVVMQACAQWRESAESRATWHAYHLIGDVLRSDDLAADPARDADFMNALRARLASEPVVLAPKPLEVAAPVQMQAQTPAAVRVAAHGGSRRWSWMAPTAVAAGFMAVASVLVLTRAPGVVPDRSAAASLAQVSPAASFVGGGQVTDASTLIAPAALTNNSQAFIASGQVIRDARLDRYLAAHKQFAGSSALGVPSGFLRNATAEAADR